jgi:hypothetical protein
MVKDIAWRAKCDQCGWSSEWGDLSHADAEALEHDRERHGGERVAVRVSEDSQVQG